MVLVVERHHNLRNVKNIQYLRRVIDKCHWKKYYKNLSEYCLQIK